MFADDLFIVRGAREDSFSVVAEVPRDFHMFAELQPNMLKSSIFLC